MAYCTVGEVLDMLKADMMNVIIGDDYIEDEQERIKVITPLTGCIRKGQRLKV